MSRPHIFIFIIGITLVLSSCGGATKPQADNNSLDNDSLEVINDAMVETKDYIREFLMSNDNKEVYVKQLLDDPNIKLQLKEKYSEKFLKYLSLFASPSYVVMCDRYYVQFECIEDGYESKAFIESYYSEKLNRNDFHVSLKIRDMDIEPNGEVNTDNIKSQAISVRNLYESYNNSIKENPYENQTVILKVNIEDINMCELEDYKYVLSAGIRAFNTIYIFSNCEKFTEFDYPKTIYIKAHYLGKTYRAEEDENQYLFSNSVPLIWDE